MVAVWFFPTSCVLIGFGVHTLGSTLGSGCSRFTTFGGGCFDTTANGLVNESGTVLSGEHHPYQKTQFKRKVEGHPVQNDITEMFDQIEKGVNHPVRQPLGVVIFSFGFNGLNTGVDGVDKTQ